MSNLVSHETETIFKKTPKVVGYSKQELCIFQVHATTTQREIKLEGVPGVGVVGGVNSWIALIILQSVGSSGPFGPNGIAVVTEESFRLTVKSSILSKKEAVVTCPILVL